MSAARSAPATATGRRRRAGTARSRTRSPTSAATGGSDAMLGPGDALRRVRRTGQRAPAQGGRGSRPLPRLAAPAGARRGAAAAPARAVGDRRGRRRRIRRPGPEQRAGGAARPAAPSAVRAPAGGAPERRRALADRWLERSAGVADAALRAAPGRRRLPGHRGSALRRPVRPRRARRGADRRGDRRRHRRLRHGRPAAGRRGPDPGRRLQDRPQRARRAGRHTGRASAPDGRLSGGAAGDLSRPAGRGRLALYRRAGAALAARRPARRLSPRRA